MQKSERIKIAIPGRVCLFGEHSDWAGSFRSQNPQIPVGRTIITGTDVAIHARAKQNNELIVTSVNSQGKAQPTYKMPMKEQILLEEAQHGQFYRYVAGVAYQVKQQFPEVGGIEINNYLTELPMRKGLSSSAAICVLTVRAFNLLYDLGLNIEQEMELAYLGERTTPSQCGRMDQGCAYGNRPVCMTFDGDQMRAESLKTKKPLYLVIVDLAGSKDTTQILQALQSCYPEAKKDLQKGVQKLFGEINLDITRRARTAIIDGDVKKIGELMQEAQQQFDQYARPLCPEQLNSPILHSLLADKELRNLVLGGKGVGSQGDGSAQFIVEGTQSQQQVMSYISEKYPQMHAFSLTVPQSLGT